MTKLPKYLAIFNVVDFSILTLRGRRVTA